MSEPPKLYNTPTVLTFGLKGGVGKSLMTKYITDLLAQRHRIALIDADIDSPNLPDVLGVTELMTLDENRDFIPARYGDNVQLFSMRLYMTNEDQAFTQSGDQNVQIIRDGLYYTVWNDPDFVVVDLPAGSSDELRAMLLNLNNLLGMVVVTLPNTTSDLRRCIEISSFFHIPILGVIENMSYVDCPCGCDHRIRLFSDGDESAIEAICRETGVRYIGGLPYLPELHGEDNSQSTDSSEVIENIVEVIYARHFQRDVRVAEDGPVLDEGDAETVQEEEHPRTAN